MNVNSFIIIIISIRKYAFTYCTSHQLKKKKLRTCLFIWRKKKTLTRIQKSSNNKNNLERSNLEF